MNACAFLCTTCPRVAHWLHIAPTESLPTSHMYHICYLNRKTILQFYNHPSAMSAAIEADTASCCGTGNTDKQPIQSSLSKSQLKKLKKREKWLDQRGERRKLEREKQKAKRRAAAEERNKLGLERLAAPKIRLMSESNNKFRVVIDMDFEEFMTEAETGASAKQVARIYSLNRHAENPCQLHVSSFKGKIEQTFATKNTGYKNWDCHMHADDYLNIFKTSDHQRSSLMDDDYDDNEESFRKKFVYLTGDAQEDLPDVEEILKDDSKIFIIGGLVDHNRHKMLCYTKASDKNISTARLPIAKYVKLSQRSILSTVAVFEIMLNILGSQMTWSEALHQAIPKRKIAQSSDDQIGDAESIEINNS